MVNACAYVCGVREQRAASIRRNCEAGGFRNALGCGDRLLSTVLLRSAMDFSEGGMDDSASEASSIYDYAAPMKISSRQWVQRLASIEISKKYDAGEPPSPNRSLTMPVSGLWTSSC